MDAKTQNFIGCGVLAIIITLGIIGYVGYSIFSFSDKSISKKDEMIPSQIKEAKILKGESFLAKTEIFRLNKLTFWQTILKGFTAKDKKEKEQFINSEVSKGIYGFDDIKVIGSEIIAVGKFGGYVFDLKGNLKREILFEPQLGEMSVYGIKTDRYYEALDELRIVETSKDKYVFLTQSSVDGIHTYDQYGKTVWKFGDRNNELTKDKTSAESEKEVYVTEVSMGDLDDDGIAEYLVSQKNDGIRAFDQQGKEKWFQPDDFPTAELQVVDIEGDGQTELFEFQGKSSKIRDRKTGNILKKLEIQGEEILPVEKSQQKEPIRFFEFYEGRLKIYDATNKIILNIEAPLSEVKRELPKDSTSTPKIESRDGQRIVAMPDPNSSVNSEGIYEPKSVWVSLEKDKPKYLAIIASFIGIPRSNLYVYNSKGDLVYHELLPEDAETITVLPNQNGNESILIGGKDTIWKFSAN